jgi:predicted DNA binding CopG/RHH family protein
MALPITSKSRCITLRLPVEKIAAYDAHAEEQGVTRHHLIKLALSHALQTGVIAELVKNSQKVKAPA